MSVNPLLSKSTEELTIELEEILSRLETLNTMPVQRSRNLSLAITNLENTLDKMYRVNRFNQ